MAFEIWICAQILAIAAVALLGSASVIATYRWAVCRLNGYRVSWRRLFNHV